MASIPPHFGAVHVAPRDVHKIAECPELGFPDMSFVDSYNPEHHKRANDIMTGALRAVSKNPNIRVGSYTPIEVQKLPHVRENQKGSVVFTTLADTSPGIDPLYTTKDYKPTHPEEKSLTAVLDKAHIPYTRNPFIDLYKSTRKE